MYTSFLQQPVEEGGRGGAGVIVYFVVVRLLVSPLGDPVFLRDDGVGQLLGEVVQLGQPVQLEVCVVEAVIADVVVDIGNLAQGTRHKSHKTLSVGARKKWEHRRGNNTMVPK